MLTRLQETAIEATLNIHIASISEIGDSLFSVRCLRYILDELSIFEKNELLDAFLHNETVIKFDIFETVEQCRTFRKRPELLKVDNKNSGGNPDYPVPPKVITDYCDTLFIREKNRLLALVGINLMPPPLPISSHFMEYRGRNENLRTLIITFNRVFSILQKIDSYLIKNINEDENRDYIRTSEELDLSEGCLFTIMDEAARLQSSQYKLNLRCCNDLPSVDECLGDIESSPSPTPLLIKHNSNGKTQFLLYGYGISGGKQSTTLDNIGALKTINFKEQKSLSVSPRENPEIYRHILSKEAHIPPNTYDKQWLVANRREFNTIFQTLNDIRVRVNMPRQSNPGYPESTFEKVNSLFDKAHLFSNKISVFLAALKKAAAYGGGAFGVAATATGASTVSFIGGPIIGGAVTGGVGAVGLVATGGFAIYGGVTGASEATESIEESFRKQFK